MRRTVVREWLTQVLHIVYAVFMSEYLVYCGDCGDNEEYTMCTCSTCIYQHLTILLEEHVAQAKSLELT